MPDSAMYSTLILVAALLQALYVLPSNLPSSFRLPTLPSSHSQPRADTVDVLIAGGIVHDGSGTAGRAADVALRGNRVVFLGVTPQGTVARQRIDARGLIVAPGFIDPHTHAYEGLPRLGADRRQNLSSLMQGITTVVLGADGRGPFDVARTLDESVRAGLGTNTYALVGFGTVRSHVMGASSAAASRLQIDSMRALITRAMREGAYGVGSGLFYAPQSYATTEEAIAVISAAREFGGVYDTHQRDESSYSIGLLNSVRESIRIGCESGLTANIGHIKALGVDVWGKADSVLAIMRDARARGCKVTGDQYPWTASGTGLSAALLPRWSQAGGRDSLLARIADPAARERMLVETRDNLRRRGGDSTILFTGGGGAAGRAYVGKTLRQVAAEKRIPPAETAIEMVRDGADMSVASFNMSEPDIETFMRDPYIMTSSDGSGGHPRMYGTYPRKIRRYVLDKPVITMERMIHSSAGQVAEVYGLADRGVLRPGAFADLIVFDPRTIRDEATYVEPTKLATGMRWVFVNGVAAVANSTPTGALAGQALRRTGRPAAR
ncbi:MAG TPA: amidohydrolase family protein [Gemmatimonas sp.]|nr:amidohydrolase family protein [Gemmatimonas sp.]